MPPDDAWPGLPAMERERRAWVLGQIRRRIVEDGPHEAIPSPDRGHLFLPFAALKGYGEMTRETEGRIGHSE